MLLYHHVSCNEGESVLMLMLLLTTSHSITDSIKFAQDVNVETSFYTNGSIREAEISFKVSPSANNRSYNYQELLQPISCIHDVMQPPLVCDFQNASYMIMFTGGNKTWYMDDVPVVIIDSQMLIKRESETGFTINTEYTVTITVYTDYANISSSKQFSEYTILFSMCIYINGCLSCVRIPGTRSNCYY